MTDVQRQLGRYELSQRLAKGGMGEIYLAKSRGAGGFEKQVIIKTILPHLAEDQEFVTKFLDEGRTVVNLTHGNIVPVFDMGEENGEYFIAMEYVSGRDLRDILSRLRKKGQLMPIELALYVAIEVCKGLSYAHRKVDHDGTPLSIVHRDVSPSNVLLSQEGEVKIIDFGIARATGRISQTLTGKIQGKCCYMSPEQAAGKSVDARSDIFSTGIVLYEMLTGIRPFEGDNDLETLGLVRECNFDPPSVLRPEIDSELDAIIQRAMAPKLDDRYHDIDKLQLDLSHYLYTLGQSALTSQSMALFLKDIFPEGVAHKSLKAHKKHASATDSAQPIGLEDALNLEFDKLVGDNVTHTKSLVSAPDNGHALSQTPSTAQEGRPPTRKITHEESPALISTGTYIATPENSTTRPTRTIELSVTRHSLIAALIIGGALIAAVAIALSMLFGSSTAQSPNTAVENPEPNNEPGAQVVIQTPPIRTFTIQTDPIAAEIIANGESLGISPQTIALSDGDYINLAVEDDRCQAAPYTLSYSHQSPTVSLKLQCAKPSDTDTQTEQAVAQRTDRPIPRTKADAIRARVRTKRQDIQFNSRPTGALITVNGEQLGHTPIIKQFFSHQEIEITATLDGYEPLSMTQRVDAINDGQLLLRLQRVAMGCLNFRAMHPAHNLIAVNAQWLEGRRMMLRNHPVPAGLTTITVRNPELDKEETFTVEVEAGDKCTHLVVWEP